MSLDGDAPRGLSVVPDNDLPLAALRGERAVTLDGLRARLRQVLAPELELAEPPAARLALADVVAALALEDPRLRRIARRGGRGWLRLLDGVHEALDALVDREDALAVVARGDDATAARASFLLRASEGVSRVLARAGLVDPRTETWRLAERVARSDPRDVADALAALTVTARGVVAWSRPLVALFRALDASLSRVGGRAVIELPAFESRLDAAQKQGPLDVLAFAVASALDDAPHTTPVGMPLGDLRISDDAPAALVRSPDIAIEVRTAADGPAQARAVADAVHAALAAGAALDEVVVAVVSGRSAPGLAVLRALSEADIPAVDLRRSGGLASKLLALLDFATEVASNGLAREDVALLLRSRYLDAPTVAGDAAATAATLAVVASALEETATVDADDAAARLVATVAVALPPGDGDAREGLLRVASRTGLALARVARGNTRRDHTASLRALVADLGIDVAIRGQRARVGGLDGPLFADDLAARARDEAAWADFQRRLAAYERCCERLGIADAPTPLQTFRHELGWTATGASPAVSPSTSTVRVVDLADLRQEPLALVVLADADEEGWPDGARRSALVPRALGARLADALDPAARPIVEAGAAAVLARVALGVAGARRVVLSWAVLGEDGESRRAAPLLALLARGASGRVWTSGPDVQRPLSAQEERLVTLARDPAAAARIAPDVVRRLQLDARRTLAFGRTPSDGDPVAQSLPLGAPFAPILTAESGGGDRPVSASAVDALASCVFKGYATLVLRTRRPRAANDLADDREAGEVIHDGLEAAFRATSHLWRARPRDAETLLREGLAAADAAFAAGAVASRLARVTRDQARAGVRAVLAWSIADEAWDFALAEQAFGEPGAWDAVVLDWRGIRVAVRGRIDRVDVSHAGELAPRARVIDYKPKATSAERHTRSFGVTKLQLALYGRATEAAIGRPVEVGLYLPAQRLRPGATFAKGVDAWRAAHESEDGAPRYFEPIHASLTALRRGNVGPVPVDAEACTHCDFAGLCRKPRYAPGTPLGDEDGDEGDG